MSPKEKENFLQRWIHKPHRQIRSDSIGTTLPVSSQKRIDHLREKMIERQNAVDYNIANYVQATLEYGVEQTRTEYRTLANRNWKIIQRFGVRATRILLLFVVFALALGVFQLDATLTANDAVNNERNDRRHSIEEKCKSGKDFHRKLKGIIARLPEPKKAEAEGQIGFTEELTSTVVPITDEQCKLALAQAGFSPTLEGE